MKAILLLTIFAIAANAVTICDKYANASVPGAQNSLVSAVVGATFTAVTADGTPTKSSFDGSVCNSVNFIGNAMATQELAADLVAFFGQDGVLGCSDPTFPNYNGNPSMAEVHRKFPINLAAFNFFNNALLGVLNANGVTVADQNAVNAILQTTAPAICNQPDCPSFAGTTGIVTGCGTTSGAMTTFAPFAALLVALLVAFFQ